MKMKLKQFVGIALAVVFAMTATVHATVTYNDVIVAIFGSGNPNTGWTSDADNGIVVALRGKNRENASTANVDGVYAMPVGYQAPANTRARWNVDISINSGGVPVGTYDYYYGVDLDPSVGISYFVLDMLTNFNDNSFGDNTTLNGFGVEGPSSVYAGIYNVMQQSQNIVFYGQDPNQNATYDYVLYAVAKGAGPNGVRLASTTIQVVVGSGGATVEQLLAQIAESATNHGDYVSRVTELANYLNGGGVISNKERALMVSGAAKSSVGK